MECKKTFINKKRAFTKNVVNYFKEYCEATGIHGFRYIGESRTICEKIWWLTMFVISLILCVLCILPVYTKWEENPVIISFSTRNKPIADIPLPAVTICSESKVNSSVFDYENAIKRKIYVTDLTEKEKYYLDTLSNVCKAPKESDSVLNYSRTEEFLDIFREVSPDFSIIDCVYMNMPFFACETFFKPILTDEGFCYTFNILDRTELYNENVVHYKDFHDMESTAFEVYPLPAFLPGAKHGLTFVLKAENKEVEAMCRGSVEGYRVSIHETASIPSPTLDFSHIPYDQTFSASITVNEITTAETVRNYSPEKRHCYFPSERKLKYFKVYNENNCILECLTKIMLKECKCVLFYMPRENDTRICQEADSGCTEEVASKAMLVRVLDTSKQHFDDSLTEDVQNQSCRCLPACSDISYTTTISRTNWNWKREIASGYYQVDDSFNITNYHLSKILLHTPIRILHPGLRYIRIPYNQAISASIRASQITTSTTVQNYPPEKRQCYFPSEKKLKYFKIYSQSNCNTECLTNATLLLCKCVIFDMPRENGTRICQAADYECTQNADYLSQDAKIYDELTSNKIKLRLDLKKYSCHCLPMCSGISYRMRISQAQWNWTEEIQNGYYVVEGMKNISNHRLSKVNIFFSGGNFIGSERNEFYSPTDFLANCGGLLGLFSGFSVLSLMEIIYFLSLRLICNIRLSGNWSG